MADPAEYSQARTAIRITVDSGKMDEIPKDISNDDKELPEIESVDENSLSNSETENKFNAFAEKPRDRVLRPSLFLRPSALSGEAFKSNSSSNVPSPKLSVSNNKFASPDTSIDPTLDSASKAEKNDVKVTLINPINIPAPSPLSNPDYVFGQNMLSRVTDRCDAVNNGTDNGALLFSAALSSENGKEVAKDEDTDGKESSSLLEDAARCQEQRATKRKYEEVLVSTGEENEINVLQITVKLFAFEGGSWVERGRGTLRLNDTTGSDGGSRIVVRTLGSLRVVLNTKIWSGMEIARANERSIRTTALDASGQLKIFLIQGNPTDVSSLHTSMEIRLRRCQDEVKSQGEVQEDVINEPAVDSKKEEEDECSRPPKAPALETAS